LPSRGREKDGKKAPRCKKECFSTALRSSVPKGAAYQITQQKKKCMGTPGDCEVEMGKLSNFCKGKEKK